MKLLYRGEKYSDESLFDYVRRLASYNGFSTFERFRNLLLEFYEQAYGELDVERLSWYSTYDVEYKNKNYQWYKCRLALELILKRNINKSQLNILSSSEEKGVPLKVCKNCWGENPYVRFYWRFASYVVCHKHNSKLIYVVESYHRTMVSPITNDGSLEDGSVAFDPVLMRSIELYGSQDFALEKVNHEMHGNQYIRELIEWVSCFFQSELSVKLNDRGATSLSESGALVGLTIYERMERLIKVLLQGNDEVEKSVRILIVLRIKSRALLWGQERLYSLSAKEFDYWASCEGFSIDDLFYAYTGFGALGGCPMNYKFKEEVDGFSGISDHQDRMLCIAIYTSTLLSPYASIGVLPRKRQSRKFIDCEA